MTYQYKIKDKEYDEKVKNYWVIVEEYFAYDYKYKEDDGFENKYSIYYGTYFEVCKKLALSVKECAEEMRYDTIEKVKIDTEKDIIKSDMDMGDWIQGTISGVRSRYNKIYAKWNIYYSITAWKQDKIIDLSKDKNLNH